jgi:hypothetical protein
MRISNCPDEAILHKAFTLFDCKEELRQQHSSTKAPVMLGAPISMIWAADFVRQENANYVMVLGPVFGRDVSLKSNEEILHTLSQNQEVDMSIATRLELMQSSEPLRQAKTSVIVFISLCVRAAIEGGLMPEVAYSVGDSYIQSVENAQKPSEMVAISKVMTPVRYMKLARKNRNVEGHEAETRHIVGLEV